MPQNSKNVRKSPGIGSTNHFSKFANFQMRNFQFRNFQICRTPKTPSTPCLFTEPGLHQKIWISSSFASSILATKPRANKMQPRISKSCISNPKPQNLESQIWRLWKNLGSLAYHPSPVFSFSPIPSIQESQAPKKSKNPIKNLWDQQAAQNSESVLTSPGLGCTMPNFQTPTFLNALSNFQIEKSPNLRNTAHPMSNLWVRTSLRNDTFKQFQTPKFWFWNLKQQICSLKPQNLKS